MSFEIIDFHTHPFIDAEDNICVHKNILPMSHKEMVNTLDELGISKFCGSVICMTDNENETPWDKIRRNNTAALKLRDLYGDAYIPGFHIHPDYVEESLAEIRKMASLGVKLIGEIVPSSYGWKNYDTESFSILLDEAEKYNMVVSLHTTGDDAMDVLVKRHPNLTIVAAHPGEFDRFMRHIARAKMSDNYYLDISGTGITRYGMLKRAVDVLGADRILFGTDFPICDPTMYVGALLNDRHLTDSQKEQILSQNAKRLLRL